MQMIILYLLKLYRALISPLFLMLGMQCRYYPSCSRYASQCFENMTLPKATKLTLKRLGRCHPWSAGGVDFPS